ncbi:hypothetical protein niasHS_018059 [Heterodera schachtii]|uniref:G-protein coupled receptors family 1 profile domain-containing protein n=2 Tax=Heterodera schachtii TaxID=97005 RepID=A0ABD2HP92_HETSC
MDPLHQCSTDVFQLPDQSPVYEILKTIKEFYQPIHTYLSIVLCAVGTVCNVCNIVVLTRKKMRSPVNLILCAMACCDTVVLSSNMVYTTHYTFVAFNNCVPKNWSYGWCVFLISHAHLSLVGHSSSIWLSVMLALIRYITLRRRGKAGGVQIGVQHSYIAIASVVIFVSLMNGPNFLTYKISEQTLDMTCGDLVVDQYRNHTAYVPGVADVALEADCLVFRLAFWITGAVFKLFPCLLLTLLVSLLMRILREVRDNRQRLFLAGRGCATTAAATAALTVDAPSSSQQNIQPDSVSNATAVFFFSTHCDQHERPPLPPLYGTVMAKHSQQHQRKSSSPSPSALSSAASVASHQHQCRHNLINSDQHSPISSSSHHDKINPINGSVSPGDQHHLAIAAATTTNCCVCCCYSCTNGRHVPTGTTTSTMARAARTNSPMTTSPSAAEKASQMGGGGANGVGWATAAAANAKRPKSGSGAGVSRTDRTTRMLLTIVCVFLITELPQGVMAVLNGMFSEEFHYNIYNRVGDILDLLSLCNACTSFIIYCTMSAQFRKEFRRVFLPAYSRLKCWHRFVLRFDAPTNGSGGGGGRHGMCGGGGVGTLRDEISEGKNLLDRDNNGWQPSATAQYGANMTVGGVPSQRGTMGEASILPSTARICPLIGGIGQCFDGTTATTTTTASADNLLPETVRLRSNSRSSSQQAQGKEASSN